MKESGSNITRKDFKEAMLKLYKTVPLKSITVRMLCETAGYNRSTFYLHYQDIYELLRDMDNDILEYLWENIVEVLNAGLSGTEIPDKVKDFFISNSEQFSIMIQSDPEFQKKLHTIISGQFLKYAKSEMDAYRAEYTICAVKQVILMWLQRGRDLSIEQMLILIRELDQHYLTVCDWSSEK